MRAFLLIIAFLIGVGMLMAVGSWLLRLLRRNIPVLASLLLLVIWLAVAGFDGLVALAVLVCICCLWRYWPASRRVLVIGGFGLGLLLMSAFLLPFDDDSAPTPSSAVAVEMPQERAAATPDAEGGSLIGYLAQRHVFGKAIAWMKRAARFDDKDGRKKD
ncbi:hypothetical protein [Aquabacterium humicola]|uniref:hypothetical protein n=1 Tax=Aquabacterium humicola TaxID=3237377 RepID=UPI002543554A|nr:hypothetical protein [Rubrivivax pictus]